jgi:hypothetical protein
MEITGASNYYNGYVSAAGEKQVVKYEFNTTDEQGNKVMDKMSKEETLTAMKEISSQYGEDVIVEFSGDGMAALVESGKKGNLDEILQPSAEKQAAMNEAVVQLENTYRMVIPNIQANEKLYNSLEGADENAVKAANGIIKNYFLPDNVGDASEEERQEMIAFGMEEAKYVAENYLDDENAADFFSAMETIAKYGMNGTVDENGNVTYDIKKGTMVDAPNDYVNRMDVLKSKAPDLYNEINELNYSIVNRKNSEKYSTKFLELYQKAEKVLNNASSDEDGKTNQEAAVEEYADWKEKIEETKLPNVFSNVKYDNLQSFFVSLQNQSNLSNSWITENMNRFAGWLSD